MKNSLKQFIITALFGVLLLGAFTAQADHKKLIMGRSLDAFPETMSALQAEIKKSGYTISIVQRVDVGLTGMGYQTDKYRVVFFGKPEEIKKLPVEYPELTPYLPLAIAIFAEEQETVLTAMSPMYIDHQYGESNPKLSEIFQRWEKDITTIIKNVCLEK